MANVTIELIVTGDDVTAGLEQLAAALSPTSIDIFLGEWVAPFLQERARFRFSSEGDKASGKWPALRPSTVRVRAHGIETGEYTGISAEHPINRRTGDLETYITSSNGFLAGDGTLFWPNPNDRTGDLEEKIGRAQGLDPHTQERAVLAIDEDDVVIVLDKLADFLTMQGVSRA